MIHSYGLIDEKGNIVNGSGDFSVELGLGRFVLKFQRNVRSATVVASVRNLRYCDDQGLGVTVCNHGTGSDHLGFQFDDPAGRLGFSFVLINYQDGGGEV